jgi:hypothetical protein
MSSVHRALASLTGVAWVVACSSQQPASRDERDSSRPQDRADAGAAEPSAPAAPSADAARSDREDRSLRDAGRPRASAQSDAGTVRSDGGIPKTADGGRASGDSAPAFALDCGPRGVAIESAGPPKNRVNYVILGDGYTSAQLDTTYQQHIQAALKKRFGPIGEPYGRYRKFVNICALKIASQTGPIGNGATALSCSGDDQSRLARCDQQAANRAIAENLPADIEVDWKAVVLNSDRWWNTGAVLMLWSGAHKDAAGAALHEGGHGFHQLADEYAGSNSGCEREYNEVNSSADRSTTGGKWDRWLDYAQAGATGKQGVFEGSRYCDKLQFRPSSNSMMNSLFGDNPNTSFNPVSREKMIMDIWRAVRPIDATEPPAGEVHDPATLALTVIDPDVIDVDWSVDGQIVAADGPLSFDVAEHALSAGVHTIAARAYDNAGDDLVRYRDGGNAHGRMNWARSQQTVTWTVTVP